MAWQAEFARLDLGFDLIVLFLAPDPFGIQLEAAVNHADEILLVAADIETITAGPIGDANHRVRTFAKRLGKTADGQPDNRSTVSKLVG
jgi:hypothetical protein